MFGHNPYSIYQPQSSGYSSGQYKYQQPVQQTQILGQRRNFAQLYAQQEHMNCIIEPTYEQGGIWLGDIDAASNYTTLQENKIGAVLTVAARTGLKYNENIIPYHDVISSDDHPHQNLIQYFDRMHQFIDKAREKTNILIHCFAGISRSATALISYLMKTQQWSFDKTLAFVQSKRVVVNPNPGFVKQLLQYETQLLLEESQKYLKKQRSDANLENKEVLKNKIENYINTKNLNTSGNLKTSYIQPPTYPKPIAPYNQNYSAQKQYSNLSNSNVNYGLKGSRVLDYSPLSYTQNGFQPYSQQLNYNYANMSLTPQTKINNHYSPYQQNSYSKLRPMSAQKFSQSYISY